MSVSVTLATAGADAQAHVEVSDGVFGGAFNEALVHQAVVAYLAGARQGSKAQKSRADARGGGRKPWRQKRTGRARAGSIRSPLWRGGGRTFAARPRDHSVKLNRKMYRGAMRCILAELVRQNRLQAIPPAALSLDAPKTKALDEKLRALALTPGKLLLVAAEVPRNLYLAARNLRGVDVCDVEALDPVALVSHDTVLVTVDALRHIEERLQSDARRARDDAEPDDTDGNRACVIMTFVFDAMVAGNDVSDEQVQAHLCEHYGVDATHTRVAMKHVRFWRKRLAERRQALAREYADEDNATAMKATREALIASSKDNYANADMSAHAAKALAQAKRADVRAQQEDTPPDEAAPAEEPAP